jgi:hypothetical protein
MPRGGNGKRKRGKMEKSKYDIVAVLAAAFFLIGQIIFVLAVKR